MANKSKLLDVNEKQQVMYCIPLWLRDEQIKSAIAKIPGRIQPQPERTDSIAIVGYGPSLKTTWKKIKDFKYVITCSGSHKFLIEKGIIPTWHVEVDPRKHKIGLLGPPHKDVEYLIASTCHPEYFDHLNGFNVKLWHVFDTSEEGLRILPPGEWAITGGCDAGLRAMTIASFLGFRDLHIFGMDGSAPTKKSRRHAGDHPNSGPHYIPTEFKGKKYLTTPAMLEAARGVVHELKQMPAVRATFYGKGLIQAMAKDFNYDEQVKTNSPNENVVAFAKPELISQTYLDLNRKLHSSNLAYGVGGGKHAQMVLKFMEKIPSLKSVLDYGCGKGYLAKALPFPIWEFDPAVPGKEEAPRPADLVVCGDVLEHIEPDKLDYVLGDLARCVKQVGYFVIHTGPSSKSLEDGRNAHLIQKPLKWWEKKLREFFQVGKINQVGPELYVVVGPQVKQPKKLKKAKVGTS